MLKRLFKFRSNRSPRPLTKFQPRLESLEDRIALSASVTTSITGLNNTGWYPPDTGIAAGPSYVLETVNESLAIYSKSSGALVSSESLATLFSGFNSGSIGYFDPQVMYDDQAGRFVIEALVKGSNTAYVDFAVSNSSDPTQGFTERQQVEVDQGGTDWLDNAKMGFNADAYVISGNLYAFSGSGGPALLLTINKSSVLDQNSSTLTDYTVLRSGDFSLIPARMHGSTTGSPMWLVESTWSGSTAISVVRMDSVLSTSPTFTYTSVGVNSYSIPTITQPGGTISGGAVDCRTLDVEWFNNNLVSALNSAVGPDAAAAWYEFNTGGSRPALTQQGVIHPGTGISTYMPGLAVDASGDLGLTYMESSATEYASVYVTGRLASDPLNVLEGSVLVQAGNGQLTGNRAGDYAGVSLDPSSANTFWGANEYGLSGVAGGWGTAIAQFQVANNSSVAPPTITVAASANPNLVTGISTNLSVQATDSSGGGDITYSWSVLSGPAGVPAPTFSVNNSTTSNNTTALFSAAGAYTFQVAAANAGGTVTSTVSVAVNQTLTSITVAPATVSLADGQSQGFAATARDQFGNAMSTQPPITWSVSGSGAITSAGVYTAPGGIGGLLSGTDTVVATSGSLSGQATVNYGGVPAAPSNLTAKTVSPTEIDLAWTNNSGNETGFIIQYSTNGGKNWTTLTTISSTAAVGVTVTYQDKGVSKKKTYLFRVAATNAYGTSSWSNLSTGTQGTPTGDGDSPVVYVPGHRYTVDAAVVGAMLELVDASGLDYLAGNHKHHA